MNKVLLIGRLTKDPELRYASTGTVVSNFTLAVSRNLSKEKRQEMESQGKPTADFLRVIFWGKPAENISRYLTKGSQCAVEGRIETGSYEGKNGNIVYTTDIIGERIEFIGSSSNQGQSGNFGSEYGSSYGNKSYNNNSSRGNSDYNNEYNDDFSDIIDDGRIPF